MIAAYYNVDHNQDYIFEIMDTDNDDEGCSIPEQLHYYKSSAGLDKQSSDDDYDPKFTEVVNEIDNGRPLKSGTSEHARACIGYTTTMHGLRYISINDPWPVDDGDQYLELWGSVENHIYVKN